MQIIDAHVHIFPPEVAANREAFRARDTYFAELYANPKARIATADDVVAELDRTGCAGAVAVAWGWNDAELRREQNAYMVDIALRFSNRLVCLAAAHPDDSAGDLERVGDAIAGGLRGIGELMPHGQGYRLGDGVPGAGARLASLAAMANFYKVPILTHVSEPVGHGYPGKGDVGPSEFLSLAATYPETRFVAAHWGGGLPFYALMPEVRRVLANTWFDSAASPYLYHRRVYRIGVDLVGADHVLFGSDFALLPIDRALRQVERAGLDDVERRCVLGGNAATVYGPFGPAKA